MSISLITDFLFLVDVVLDFETEKEELSVEDADLRFLSLDDVGFVDFLVDASGTGLSDVVEDAVMERVTRIFVRIFRKNTTRNRSNQSNIEMLSAGVSVLMECRRRKEGKRARLGMLKGVARQ